jgi:hypothetical protein
MGSPSLDYVPAPLPANPSDSQDFSTAGKGAAGAAVGSAVGLGIGMLATKLLRPPAEVGQVGGSTLEETEQKADEEIARLQSEKRAFERKRRALIGTLSTVGAAVGAAISAPEGQRGRAATGAALVTGVVHAGNIAANPEVGAPGLGAAALGAYMALSTGE